MRVWLREMADGALQTLERVMNSGGSWLRFRGVSSQPGALRAGFMPLLCSPTVPIKGAQGPRRGFFNFYFWKVLSQEGQRPEELLDVARASETRRPQVSSLSGSQPVP